MNSGSRRIGPLVPTIKSDWDLPAIRWCLLTVFFSPAPVTDFDTARACDLEAHGRFCRALLERGVYPPPSQFEAWFVSLAHDDAAVDRTVSAAAEAFEEVLG